MSTSTVPLEEAAAAARRRRAATAGASNNNYNRRRAAVVGGSLFFAGLLAGLLFGGIEEVYRDGAALNLTWKRHKSPSSSSWHRRNGGAAVLRRSGGDGGAAELRRAQQEQKNRSTGGKGGVEGVKTMSQITAVVERRDGDGGSGGGGRDTVKIMTSSQPPRRMPTTPSPPPRVLKRDDDDDAGKVTHSSSSSSRSTTAQFAATAPHGITPGDISAMPNQECSVIFFLHVQKAAGTTLRAILQRQAQLGQFDLVSYAKMDGTDHVYMPLSYHLDRAIIAVNNWKKASGGGDEASNPLRGFRLAVEFHGGGVDDDPAMLSNTLVDINKYRPALEEAGCRVTTTTWIRQPMDHTLSWFEHFYATNIPLCLWQPKSSLQTRTLLGVTRSQSWTELDGDDGTSLGRAMIRTLTAELDHIGIVERFDESLLSLARIAGIVDPTYVARNVRWTDEGKPAVIEGAVVREDAKTSETTDVVLRKTGEDDLRKKNIKLLQRALRLQEQSSRVALNKVRNVAAEQTSVALSS